MFENNIGILVIELENTKYHNIGAVKEINEYGRRINLPYIGDGQTPHALVADSITFLGQTEDFGEKGNEIILQKEFKRNSSGYIMKPVEDLLKELLPESKGIHCVVDDRMFVCCLLRDSNLSNQISSVSKLQSNT